MTKSELEQYFSRNLEMNLALLRQMVEIHSIADNAAGVNRVGELTANLFSELGFEREEFASRHSMYGKHLLLTKSGSNKESIVFVSHLDTVFPEQEAKTNSFHWRQENGLIYGPGVCDNKGGTLVIYMVLSALREFAPELYSTYSWKIFLNCSEETESADFGELCRQRIDADTRAVLVAEASDEEGETIWLPVARKGVSDIRITATGRAAHTGLAHQSGINAITLLSKVLLQVDALTDYQNDLTMTVAQVRGGTANNKVPDYAEADCEMRSSSPERLAFGVNALQEIISELAPDHLSLDIIEIYPPWPENPGSLKLFALWQEVAADIGLSVQPKHSGGASDGSRFWDIAPTLDGIGPIGGNKHSSGGVDKELDRQEYAIISSFVSKSVLNAMAIEKLLTSDS